MAAGRRNRGKRDEDSRRGARAVGTPDALFGKPAAAGFARWTLAGPGHGEALVRIEAAGLCHSDLSVIDGNRPRPLAHGARARGGRRDRGDRSRRSTTSSSAITWCASSFRAAARARAAPRGARPSAFPARRRTVPACCSRASGGSAPTDHDLNHHLGVSAFAEYATVSRRSLVKVDRDLPFDHAALFGCAVLTGVGAVINGARVVAG